MDSADRDDVIALYLYGDPESPVVVAFDQVSVARIAAVRFLVGDQDPVAIDDPSSSA